MINDRDMLGAGRWQNVGGRRRLRTGTRFRQGRGDKLLHLEPEIVGVCFRVETASGFCAQALDQSGVLGDIFWPAGALVSDAFGAGTGSGIGHEQSGRERERGEQGGDFHKDFLSSLLCWADCLHLRSVSFRRSALWSSSWLTAAWTVPAGAALADAV